jgi:tRNA 2-selenouridine synthase SelU
VPVPIGIEHGERRLEARRYQEVLQVFVAAVDEKLDHFLVILHGVDNLRLLQVARLVDVDL